MLRENFFLEQKEGKERERHVLGNKTNREYVLDNQNSSLSVETPLCRSEILSCLLELFVQMIALDKKITISHNF